MLRFLFLAALVAGVAVWLRPQWRPFALRWARSLLWIGAALLYLRAPIDLLPDGGPAGFLDDLLVLAFTLWRVRQGSAPEWLRRSDAARDAARDAAAKDSAVPDQPPAAAPWDPYGVLGIEPGAGEEEITRAYRTQMKRFHPDRVEGLGEELREVAHRRTREIQRAYDELRRR